MSTATLEQEEKAFTTLCDQLISGSPGSTEVENAVIELEVGHKKCMNAARREFNAEVDKSEAAVKEIRDAAEKNREKDKAALQKQLDEVRKDYQGQMDQLRQKQTEEIARIKDTYETISHERKRSDSMVGRIADDHGRELQRVNDEWARKMSIKETEIMALKQEIEEMERVAAHQLKDEAVRTDAAIAQCAELENQLRDADEQKVSLHTASKEQLEETVKQQERLLKDAQTLILSLENNANDLELALSNVRVTLLNQDYAKIRDAVRSKGSSDQQDEMLKQVDDLQVRKDQERQELTSLLDRTKSVCDAQKTAIGAFEVQVTEEAQKLAALRAQKEEDLAAASKARRSRANSVSMPQPASALSRRLSSARSRRGSTAVGHGYAHGDSPQARRDSPASVSSGANYADPNKSQ